MYEEEGEEVTKLVMVERQVPLLPAHHPLTFYLPYPPSHSILPARSSQRICSANAFNVITLMICLDTPTLTQ
jgi:hypothetical protein